MFDYKHYVPILKGKRAEFPAVGNLHSKDGVTPLFEAVPKPPFECVPRRMSETWERTRPYFIDMVFCDDEDMPEDEADRHPLRTCFDEVASHGQHAIPVTGTGRSPAYQAALQAVVRQQHRGFGIRLVPEDFEDEEELPAVLDALNDYIGTPRKQIDMLVDLGTVAELSPAVVARTHRALLETLPTIRDWKTLTVISGAFPLSLGPLGRGWNTAQRNDWLGWLRLVNREIERRPSYGDYTIAHPNLPPTGRATILAQLRYCASEHFLIYKGRDVFRDRDGFRQFITICREMIERDEYSGRDFSHGDAEIYAKATDGGSPGNAERWRTIGTNHHIEMVLDQIANLP